MDRKENLEPQTADINDQAAGHSSDATVMATAFEPLSRSLKIFLTRLFRTSKRSEKSRRVFRKPRFYKAESDGCIDTWVEVMEVLLNRLGSGVQGHQAMIGFEKRRQREEETIDKVLDDLEMLRRRNQPDESNSKMNLAVA